MYFINNTVFQCVVCVCSTSSLGLSPDSAILPPSVSVPGRATTRPAGRSSHAHAQLSTAAGWTASPV